MRLVTKIAITLAAAFAIPIFLIGRMTFVTMRAIGTGASQEARRVVVESEQRGLRDFTRAKALELGTMLVVYRNDVVRLADRFEYDRQNPAMAPPTTAEAYAPPESRELPGFGRVHPKWGAYADFDRRGPGSPWLPRWAVNAALSDSAALARARRDLIDVVRLQPVLERYFRRRKDTLDLVWVVMVSGATNAHPPYDYASLVSTEPEILDLDEGQEDYVRLVNPQNNPKRRTRWLEPYFDEFKRVWMTSVVAPLYEGDTFLGSVGMDILLPTLMKRVRAIDTEHDGYAFLLAPSGMPVVIPPAGIDDLIHDPGQREALEMTLLPLAEQTWTEERQAALTEGTLLTSPDPDVRTMARAMVVERAGAVRATLGGIEKLITFARVGSTDFRLGVVVPVASLVAPAAAVTGTIGSATEAAIGNFLQMAVLIVVLSVFAAFALHYLTVRPIVRLSRGVSAVRWETLDVPEALTTRKDEVGQLAKRLAEMLGLLRRARDDLTAKSAALATTNEHLGAANSELVREVAERRRAEQALSAEKELLAVTLTSIGDGVITTDTSGAVVLTNDVAAALTGLTPEEARGRPLHEVLHLRHEGTDEPVEDPAARVLAMGRAVTLARDVVLRSKDGVERAIADSGAPIRDAKGDVVGVVLVFRDISQRVRIEKEMQRIERLESVSLLAAGIAHDFNNLLAAVLGNVSIARVDVPPESRAGVRLAEAERATMRARDLTTQLLTFSKGGAPVRTVLSLPEVLREAAGFSLRGARARCEVDVAVDLWPVWADAGQVGQVVQNLVINAEQAMPEGGIIRLQARNRTIADADEGIAPGRYVEVTVADEGCGIPVADLAHIFDPFFTTKATGSGLGLAVCFSIVQKHGGTIDVWSEPDRGATFRVLLPAAEEPATEALPRPLDIPRGQARILVMDDEPAIRAMLEEMLTLLGYEPHAVPDGSAAIEEYRAALASRRPYAAVILDLTVPGASGGKEAAVGLRAIDPEVRAIVSSGYSHDPVLGEYERYGFCAAIVKPYDLHRLAQVLRDVLAMEEAST